MTSPNIVQPGSGAARSYGSGQGRGHQPANLGDILERVLDKGLVIAGDIQVNLLDIELLTIKLRLVIASLDTAREVGINWWENDPWLSADAGRRAERRRVNGDRGQAGGGHPQEMSDGGRPELEETADSDLRAENERLAERIRELEAAHKSASSGRSGYGHRESGQRSRGGGRGGRD
jgi:hypothetical protein